MYTGKIYTCEPSSVRPTVRPTVRPSVRQSSKLNQVPVVVLEMAVAASQTRLFPFLLVHTNSTYENQLMFSQTGRCFGIPFPVYRLVVFDHFLVRV